MGPTLRPVTALPPNTGATLDREAAQEIAADAERIRATFEYWKSRFDERHEDPFDRQDTPAVRLAQTCPDGRYRDLLSDRNHLFIEDRGQEHGGDSRFLIDLSGCLVAAADIERAISPHRNVESASGATLPSLWADMRALRSAADPSATEWDQEAVARAVQGARELYDVSRRLYFCQQNAGEFALSIAELLALYRQEGALCATPPQDSFAHGPLIRTGFGCRTRSVFLFDRTAARPGFILAYRFGLLTDALRRRERSVQFDMLLRNLHVVGGLDSIAAPRLHRGDELVALFHAARQARPVPAEVKTYNDELRSKLARSARKPINRSEHLSQQGFLDDMARGFMMAELAIAKEPPTAEALLDSCVQGLRQMFDAHETRLSRRRGGIDAHLFDDTFGTGTYRCLRVQARWYASRANPTTLLAWKDRQSGTSLRRFSPFLTYLRFHTGDVLFAGILLRTVIALEALYRFWKAPDQAALGDAFPRALERTRWLAEGGQHIARLREDLQHWQGLQVRNESWHHIGLIQDLGSRSAPQWLRRVRAPASVPRLTRNAAVVRNLLDIIGQLSLLESIGTALEWTPITALVRLGVVPAPAVASEADIPAAFEPGASPAERIRRFRLVRAREVLAKSHNFERIRLVYADALKKADIGDPFST